jgi:hypothetical protein
MSTKISDLPPYIGVSNPDGDLPISILGTTYKIKPNQIGEASLGVGSRFKGDFNASTNSPTLANGFGSNGDYYKVSVGGDVDFGAGLVSLLANDFIYYNGYTGIWNLWFRESSGGGSTPIASEVDSGTVKTNVTVADPVVYLKEEVDTLVQQAIGGQLSYFFFKTVSDVAGYYKMLLNPSTGAAQDITVLNCTGTTTIANFVTEPSAPNKTYIPKGYFRSTIHAKKTGAGNATVFYEVYKRDLAGTETLIGTSSVSDANLTTSILEYRLEIYVPTQVPLLATDRIVYRARTVVASGTPDVGIYFEDSYLTGLDVPSYIVSVTEIPDASETVAGKVSVGTQTFGGNKKIVGESSTTGNALTVQNLAHENLVEIGNNKNININIKDGESTNEGFVLKTPNGVKALVISANNSNNLFFNYPYMLYIRGHISVTGYLAVGNLASSAGYTVLLSTQITTTAPTYTLPGVTFGNVLNNLIGTTTIIGFNKNFISPIVYTHESSGNASNTGLIGSFHKQIIKAQANNSVLIGMQISPNYDDNTYTGHTKIALGIESNEGFGIFQKGTLVNYLEGSLGIGITAPNASAKVQVESTTQGFSPPRMTTTQKNAIATPMAGLMVFDTTLMKLCIFTTAWETITSI